MTHDEAWWKMFGSYRFAWQTAPDGGPCFLFVSTEDLYQCFKARMEHEVSPKSVSGTSDPPRRPGGDFAWQGTKRADATEQERQADDNAPALTRADIDAIRKMVEEAKRGVTG